MTHHSTNPPGSTARLDIDLVLRAPNMRQRRLHMDYDDFLIGRAEFCDLRLDDSSVPLVYAEIHRQSGVVWVEAADEDCPLRINEKNCQRLALRDGDLIQIGNWTLEVGINRQPDISTLSSSVDEDLSQLTAEELCDRIIEEQTAVDEFERKELQSWKSLIEALESTLIEARTQDHLDSGKRVDTAITELRQLAATLQSRADQLLANESDFLETTTELRVAQSAMIEKLDLILQQFDEGDFRVSA